MKRILAFLLFASAVGVGLVLPGLWLDWRERTPEGEQTLILSEPELSREAYKNSGRTFQGALTGEEIAFRFQLFASDPDFSLSQNADASTDTTWVTDHALTFLQELLEAPPVISDFIVEYRYAWFRNGFTIPIWSVEMTFNDGWYCIMDIDGQCGAILRCIIHSYGGAFADLFSESSGTGEASGSGIDLGEQAAHRFCRALQAVMSHYGNIEVSVWPTTDPGGVNITLADHQTHSLTLPLSVSPEEGIWFNHRDSRDSVQEEIFP